MLLTWASKNTKGRFQSPDNWGIPSPFKLCPASCRPPLYRPRCIWECVSIFRMQDQSAPGPTASHTCFKVGLISCLFISIWEISAGNHFTCIYAEIQIHLCFYMAMKSAWVSTGTSCQIAANNGTIQWFNGHKYQPNRSTKTEATPLLQERNFVKVNEEREGGWENSGADGEQETEQKERENEQRMSGEERGQQRYTVEACGIEENGAGKRRGGTVLCRVFSTLPLSHYH